MSPIAKRNVANTLSIIFIIPVFVWILLALVAFTGAVFPWIAAGIFFAGKYIIFLCLFFTVPAIVWAHHLKITYPSIWTRKHYILSNIVKITLIIGILINVGIMVWNRYHRVETFTQTPVPSAESEQIQLNIDKKIRGLQ